MRTRSLSEMFHVHTRRQEGVGRRRAIRVRKHMRILQGACALAGAGRGMLGACALAGAGRYMLGARALAGAGRSMLGARALAAAGRSMWCALAACLR